MLSVELWAPICAALAIILLAHEGRKINSKVMVGVFVVLPVLIAAMASDILVHYSITHMHQFIAEFGPLIGLICLLETLVVSMGKRKLPVPMVTSVAGLIYLQMYFYQSGWLNWNFDYMAIAYGCFLSLVMVLGKALAAERLGLFAAAQFLVVGLAFAKLPGVSTKVSVVSLAEVLHSVLVFSALLGLGFLVGVVKEKLQKSRRA